MKPRLRVYQWGDTSYYFDPVSRKTARVEPLDNAANWETLFESNWVPFLFY